MPVPRRKRRTPEEMAAARALGSSSLKPIKQALLPQARIDDLKEERSHLLGVIESLKAEREQLRLRALKYASGELCSRCGEDVQTTAPMSLRAPPACALPEADPAVQQVVHVVRDKSRGGHPPLDPAIMAEALRRTAQGERYEKVAFSLGVSPSTVGGWRRRALAAASAPAPAPAPMPAMLAPAAGATLEEA